jgi:hypothetical protein
MRSNSTFDGSSAESLREGFFRGRHGGDAPLRGAIYGLLLLPFGALIIALAGRRIARSGVGFDGFHAGREHFDDKLERARLARHYFRASLRDPRKAARR